MKYAKWLVNSLILVVLIGSVMPVAFAERTTLAMSRQFGSAGEYLFFYSSVRADNALYVAGSKGADASDYWALWKLNAEEDMTWMRGGDTKGALLSIAADDSRLFAAGYLIKDAMPLYTILVTAFDLQGNNLWTREYSGSDGPHLAYEIMVLGNHLYVVGFGYYSDAEFDVVVLKYDKSGTLVWAERYGGSEYDFGYAIAHHQGRLYVVGRTMSYPVPLAEYDGLVLVLDENGNEIVHYTWGGDEFDQFRRVRVGSDLYIVGTTESYGAGGYDMLVLRMDLSGNVAWYRTYGGTGDDWGYCLTVEGERVHVSGGMTTTSMNPIYLQYGTDGSLVGAWRGSSFGVAYWLDIFLEQGVAYLVGFGADEEWTRSQGLLASYITYYDLTVNLRSADFWASVDGTRRSGPIANFEVTGAEHQLEAVPQVVDGRTRYVFSQWSDDVTANPRTIKLTGDTTLSAIYRTEVYLEVLTSYSTASESRWVGIRSRVTIGIAQTTVDHGNGTRRIFTGWYKDGILFSQEQNPSFEVTEPVTLVARWKTEYLAQATSERGTVSGGGWTESGSSTTVSITPTTIQKDFFTNYVFEGWKKEGTIVSTSASYTFTVTLATNLVASWKEELNLVTVGGVAGAVLLVVAAAALFLLRRPKVAAPPLPPPPPA